MGLFTMTSCPMTLSDMEQTDGGWHCGSCNTTVVDLTNATDEQVATKLAQGPLCGRARTNAAGRLLLAGAAAISISGLAHADSDIPVPPIPEEDTTELCDGSSTTGDSESDGEDASEPASDGGDPHGVVTGRASDVNEVEWITMGAVVASPRSSQPWGPQQSPEAARADRLAKRAQRKARRAEQARAEANDLASDAPTTGG